MQKATLVLEGGATRGVFTSGVLDYLMEQEFYTSHVIGVSAGACNAVDYVSRQPGRTRDCMIPTDKNLSYYYGVRKFIKEKSLMNMDMIFDIYPKQIYPFDFDTYFRSEMNCELVTTNCVTGKAEYMDEAQDPDRLMKICRASSSMPLLCPIVNIDGIPYLDGGLADSIPIRRAIDIGNEKIVVVLTRNRGYRKKAVSKAVEKMYRRAYRSYPNLLLQTGRRYDQILIGSIQIANGHILKKYCCILSDRLIRSHQRIIRVQFCGLLIVISGSDLCDIFDLIFTAVCNQTNFGMYFISVKPIKYPAAGLFHPF